MDSLIALQPLLLGLLLAWAGLSKTLGRLSAERARRTALPRIVGERHAAAAYRGTGGVELLIAAALLLPAAWWWEPVAAGALAIAFCGFLGYSRLVAPDASCGCLGSAAVPVSVRSLIRAGLLFAGAVAAFFADQQWTSAIRERPAVAAGLVLVELAVFIGLSAELDRWWLLPLRRARVRLTHPLAGGEAHTPLAYTEQQLLHSPAYRSVAGSLRSDVREHWDEGEWRFVTYAAAHGDGFATGVFAVPLVRYEPEAVRVAIVDDRTGATLYRADAAAAT